MNRRTAAMIIDEDVLVLHCIFSSAAYAAKLGDTKTYKYLAKGSWVTGLVEGDQLIAQGKRESTYLVVSFINEGLLTEIDLDDEDITYRWALGRLPSNLLDREAEAEADIKALLDAAQTSRVNTVREQAKILLGVSALIEPPTPRLMPADREKPE